MSLPPTTIPPADEAPSPRARGRDDACPGALRLHPADDGSLARVRIPGGLLTAGQARALAGASEELGDGRLDLTSRGNLQVRGLDAACGGELAAALRGAGLLPSDRFDRVRNIVASPLGGLDGAGCGDVTAWARELDTALCAGTWEELSGLSGRFLFAMDDGRGDVAALGADVTLIATRDGGAVLRVGSGPGDDLEVRGRDAPRAAALAAMEFLARVRASGTRVWRVRELPAQHAVTADGLAARLADEGVEAVRIGQSGREATPGVPPAPGVVSGPDGRHAVSVLVPLGRVGAAQWRLLAGLASRGGSGELRVTPWRGVVLPGFTADGAAAAAREVADAGLVTDPGSPWVGVGACTGRPGCAKSLADVRAHAARAVAGAPRSPDTPQGSGDAPQDSPDAPPVYFSGCERRCGHPGGRWVDALAISGTDYRLTVRDTREPDGVTDAGATDVAAEQLADAVATARGTA
ncbi:precorrin-3B synthase [Streptomyces sp. RTd22]|uniref:precorrin-3B synthase n=1 Tax=Streptomyces sp. RTd22 TaxID=1841249 RepID=UPI001F15E730|nr:precorrin-3B synthase [Streptomyces sp. RTd22]